MLLRSSFVASLSLIAACGGAANVREPAPEAPKASKAPESSAASPPSAAPAASASAPAPEPAPCGSPAACREAARGATDATERGRALARACDLGDGDACTDAAQAILDRGGRTPASEIVPLLEKGCAAKSGGACNGLGQVLHRAGDDERARAAFEAGCDAGHRVACHNIAELIMGGSAKMDHAALARARARACALGETADCAPPAPASPSVPGATLSVDSMSADGVLVEKLSCRVDGLGLLGAVVIVGTVAKEKAALRACGVTAPVPVTFTFQGGRVVSASANTGDAKRDACVVAALKRLRSASDGPCAARVGIR